jgi:hypothetical protein
MNPSFGEIALTEIGDRASDFTHPKSMPFDTPPLPIPSPPPINEPPDDPEDPHVPVREPDPAEPSQI